ncbi:MAG: glycosyltransferase family 2 protein [Thermomicrobiales bacterium]|nr:glycosyltransferase family 2 protein [Thermomicrobiales bacterium]
MTLHPSRPVRLLTVIVPVFDERATIAELIRRVLAAPYEKQIVAVDDGSTDGTTAILRGLEARGELELVVHPVNRGKGAAVRSGLARARGDVILIQDGDLEYDPAEYPLLLGPIEKGLAEVVYGSRFLGPHRAMYFWHSVGNKLLTLTCNALFDTTLTDMETCYKAFTAEVVTPLRLRSNRWGFDPEITAKVLKRGRRIYEVPISYAGREFHEGKKITWRDGFIVFFSLIRYRLAD